MVKLGVWSIAALVGSAALVAQPAHALVRGQVIGNDMSKCTAGATGPAMLVEVSGFKSATGRVRVQAYPGTGNEWLKKGAWINRIDVPAAPRGNRMRFCMPLPAAGTYGIAVRHDLDGDGKSGWNDGGGFSNNPDISLLKLRPSAAKTAVNVGDGITRIAIVLNYRQGTSIEPIG